MKSIDNVMLMLQCAATSLTIHTIFCSTDFLGHLWSQNYPLCDTFGINESTLMVFIPVVEDGHWILYCLNFKNKKILFYDPHRPGSREATCEATNAYLMYLGIIAPSSPWPCQVLGAVDFADLPKVPQDRSFDSGIVHSYCH